MINEDLINAPHIENWREILTFAMMDAQVIANTFGTGANGIDRMSKRIKRLPKWLSNRDLMAVLHENFTDAIDMIRALTVTCDERAHLRGHPFEVLWWTGKKSKAKKVVTGIAGPTPIRYRLTWTGKGKAPWFRVQLSLPYWLLADEMDRYRLLHHELGHCDLEVSEEGAVSPILRAHDVEEFADTIARFGLASSLQAQLGEAINSHPQSAQLANAWDVDLSGKEMRQLGLFNWKPPTTNALQRLRKLDDDGELIPSVTIAIDGLEPVN